MKTIIKLTNEYASNLNCLFLNFDGKLASYYDMFAFIFKDCLLTKDVDIVDEQYLATADIIFIKVDNDTKFNDYQSLKDFSQSLRKDKELLPVYIIKENVDDTNLLNILDMCYCLDGSIPVPFERERVYRFLYRILKRITIEKELHAYTQSLEDQLYTPILTQDIQKELVSEVKPKKQQKDSARENDIRFSQTNKISALEFMDSLDDTIIDKIENLNEELETLIGVLYDVDEANANDALALMPSVNRVIVDIYSLIESIGSFSVTARAFDTLNIFLQSITVVELTDLDRKSMFVAMLLAIISDLEKWIDVIFVHHTTEDIHYLDASFSSNIMEIENLFNDDDDDDDDDLDFF